MTRLAALMDQLVRILALGDPAMIGWMALVIVWLVRVFRDPKRISRWLDDVTTVLASLDRLAEKWLAFRQAGRARMVQRRKERAHG